MTLNPVRDKKVEQKQSAHNHLHGPFEFDALASDQFSCDIELVVICFALAVDSDFSETKSSCSRHRRSSPSLELTDLRTSRSPMLKYIPMVHC